ncbi:DUF192 domain-containing protein [Vulgatibacter incomptus]|uniref:DUF192 domain-containing protein n=1 Tax=Vulgatibacter incomptus TaxID=1391653 RepID=A0A0K1PFD1_9BACT|nr:DUF192 domain-containing protein [Vulgatibacter incomptus]AKU91824.1 hypothetical protein AKJ08_2211 [Vulgatibacter incomptus]
MRDDRFEAWNETRGTALALRARRASSVSSRLRGLLGEASFEPGDGLHIVPCNSIHTFFMRFPIDVLFLDAHGKAIRALQDIPPWRATRIHLAARTVLELPAGTLRSTGTLAGDSIALRARSDLACAPAIR